MSFLSAFLTMRATHWAKTSIDGYGNPTFADPVVLNCRWEEKSDFIISPSGVSTPSRARVFLEDDVAAGDYLFNGMSTATNPMAVPGAFKVLDSRKIPNLEGTDFERQAIL